MKKYVEPDTADLIIKMQQQLASLEKKIDTLLSQFSQRPVEVKSFHKPFQQPGQAQRTLYKAICADCNKECEVPFRPSHDRPVYCKECFSSRKAAGPFEASRDNRPKEKYISHERPFDKHQGGGKHRHTQKKKPSSKKRKN